MKRSDLQLYTVFYNSNGYLSIVYKIQKQRIHILNYNGSNYSLNIDESSYSSNLINKYKSSDISSDRFFEEFPTEKLFRDEITKFKEIIKKYKSNLLEYDLNNKRVLLLII